MARKRVTPSSPVLGNKKNSQQELDEIEKLTQEIEQTERGGSTDEQKSANTTQENKKKTSVTKNSKVKKLKTIKDYNGVLDSNTIVVIKYTADWCPSCRDIKPMFEQLAQKYAVDGKFAVAEVDVDNQKLDDHIDLPTALPTFVFHRKGKFEEKTYQIRGADKEAVIEKCEEWLRDFYQEPEFKIVIEDEIDEDESSRSRWMFFFAVLVIGSFFVQTLMR